jgi:TolB-like protein/Tfp pilus assembly protein PilF
MSLIAELQRRSVFKVGAAYLVVGWLLIQVAATVTPQLSLPDWAPRLITLLVLLGFPVALLLAWAFEMTPEGVKVDTGGTGSRRMFVITGVLAVAALGWYFVGAPAVRDYGTEQRSIAVLPFVNMSDDPANEYFSDGIAEEILNVLAQTPDLKVAARTSSFSYKGQNREIPDIARELEVRMVLEGSVRKQGDRVRITAQLIDAEKGFHLWSETYDRDLKDVFAIQDEIAREIGKQLQVQLGGGHAAGGVSGNQDLEAYDLYLQGLALFQKRGGENLHAADAKLRAAIARDPKFAKAWGTLALVHSAMPSWDPKTDRVAGDAIRFDAAERAMALDPTLPDGWLVVAVRAYDEGRYETGDAMFQRLFALAPSYAQGYQWHGEALAAAGDIEGGLAQISKGLALDPKSRNNRFATSNLLIYLGRFDEAAALDRALVAEDPEGVVVNSRLLRSLLFLGQAEQARPFLHKHYELEGLSAVAVAAGDRIVDAFAGKLSKAELSALAVEVAALPEPGTGTKDEPRVGTVVRLKLFHLAGRDDLAAPELLRYAERLPDVAATLYNAPITDAFRCRADWAALEKTLKVRDLRRAKVCGT